MATLNEMVPKKGPWATFYLGDELFAVSAADVQEVMLQQPLTPVPLAPPHIVGLLNLRGHIMPAVDLRRRLSFPPRPPEAETSLLVLKTKDSLLSVVVDSIGDVLELNGSQWEPPPETIALLHRKFVFGICPLEKEILLGLSVESLSTDEETTSLGSKG